MHADDTLPPCARCGETIEASDSDGDVLIVYSNSEREFEITGDLGTLVEAYCGPCTRTIEKAHKRHNQQVEAMRQELDRPPTYEPDRDCDDGN